MRGYKVFNSDWTCKGYQFEVGKVFEEDIKPICCEQGFHFCENLIDCFNYYYFNPNNKVAVVESLGDIDREANGEKLCTNKIYIIEEISWHKVLDMINAGKGNTGIGNTGNHNSGNHNSGCFNTKNPKLDFFNKPSNWTYSDWFNSGARFILLDIPKDTIEDEKTGVCIKKNTGDLTRERQEWWNSLSDKSKREIYALPNFDKRIFEEITGIDIEK